MVDNIWRTLTISPTNDKKEIKRAYVKQLKQTKPDIDPEGFKKLRLAYESALTLSDTKINELYEEDFTTDTELASDIDCFEPGEDETPIEEDFQWYGDYNSCQQTPIIDPDALAFLDELKQLLSSREKRDVKAYWERLLASEILMNLELRHQISCAIFDEILIVQKREFPKSRYFQVLEHYVLNILEDEFDWSNDEYLQAKYSEKDYFKIAKRPKITNFEEANIRANIFYRLLANFIDFSGVFVVVYLLFAFSSSQLIISSDFLIQNSFFHEIYFLLLTFYCIYMELGPKRATFGKQLLKLSVNTSINKLLSIGQILIRNFLKFVLIILWLVAFTSEDIAFFLKVCFIFGPLFAYSYWVKAKVCKRG